MLSGVPLYRAMRCAVLFFEESRTLESANARLRVEPQRLVGGVQQPKNSLAL